MLANYGANLPAIHSFSLWLFILRVFSLVQHLSIFVGFFPSVVEALNSKKGRHEQHLKEELETVLNMFLPGGQESFLHGGGRNKKDFSILQGWQSAFAALMSVTGSPSTAGCPCPL